MKLLQYSKNGTIHVGIKTDNGIINVEDTVAKSGSELPVTLEKIIEAYGNNKECLKEYLKLDAVYLSENEVTYAPCVSNAGKILCVGLNYHSHTKEINFKQPEIPTIFNKFNDSLIGHQAMIHLPKEAYKFDYEAELVIVIGKTAHNVSEQDALTYVFGYTAGNDFSARDLQTVTGQWLIGKACDDFGPIGPYIVTADEIDPQNLDIQSKVNGEVRQSSNTKNMIFSCAKIISYITKYITLRPGDLIFTGTPEGVILGKPADQQQWLKSGDTVDVTIEKIGTLTNKIR